jgi:hypothetical protein
MDTCGVRRDEKGKELTLAPSFTYRASAPMYAKGTPTKIVINPDKMHPIRAVLGDLAAERPTKRWNAAIRVRP